MVNLQTIMSDVQMDLGDMAHTAVQRAEYVDTLNNIIRKVALDTRVWINRLIFTPNTGTQPTPVYQCAIPAVNSPVYLLTVYRKATSDTDFLECREYGYQSNMATLRNESSFQKNDIQLGRRNFHTQYRDENTLLTDDGLYIIFNEEIEINEQIAVDFISIRPINVVLWTNGMTLQVPDFLEDSIRYGLQWKLMERIYNRGNEAYGSRSQLAKANYNEALHKARAIALNYKDLNSSMQITPIRYLPEQPRYEE